MSKPVVTVVKKALVMVKPEPKMVKKEETKSSKVPSVVTKVTKDTEKTKVIKAKKVEPVINFKAEPVNFKDKPLKNISATIFAIILKAMGINLTTSFEQVAKICEISGLPYLKNKGSATENNQLFLKSPARSAFGYLIEFGKCLDNDGNKKTTSAYHFALKKMNPAHMKYCMSIYSKSFGIDYAKLRTELLHHKEVTKIAGIEKMIKTA